MPTIYLIRHAEPLPPHIWDGNDAERPLSQRGLLQAQWMGQHLQGLEVTDFRTASHLRCRQTAEAIGQALSRQPVVDAQLHISRSFRIPKVEGIMIWVAHSNNIPGAINQMGVPGYRCGHASAWKLEFAPDASLLQSSYIEPEVSP